MSIDEFGPEDDGGEIEFMDNLGYGETYTGTSLRTGRLKIILCHTSK